ncbi:junctional adhesion molecule A-like isoform X2 [Onychostoma macrolepis]|uniref:junctional adhesion molecule A-like isoform X2 n=1 Tax=Onychostoma macrolepis TaxID=369639 RepID=UPI00272AC81E|nr:junctional adhesion molecule A-like isoform X2 [Onychostoma macrolepis]
MALLLPLIFSLMIHRVSGAGWGVSYSPSHICALKHSSVIMNCTYTYPTGHQVKKVFWTKTQVKDLQVESPERVTEGDSVRLTCKSSCALTDGATFIWYRNSQPLTERRDRNNQLLLQSVRREDAGRYNCAVHGHTYISPAVHLSVTYPPKNVSVSISPSGEKEDSVTLICSSDSNPPAEINWFKENQSSAVGSGQSFSALQSGRFYCEAHNQHGSQRSDAVTVTVKGGDKTDLYAAVAIAAGCGVLFLICIIMFIRKRKSGVSDVKQKQVQQPSSSEGNHCDDGLYARVSPRADQTAGKTKQIMYTTIQYIRNNVSNKSLRVHHPDSAARSDAMVGKSVIYSTVK